MKDSPEVKIFRPKVCEELEDIKIINFRQVLGLIKNKPLEFYLLKGLVNCAGYCAFCVNAFLKITKNIFSLLSQCSHFTRFCL